MLLRPWIYSGAFLLYLDHVTQLLLCFISELSPQAISAGGFFYANFLLIPN